MAHAVITDDPFAVSPEMQAQRDRIKVTRTVRAGVKAMRSAFLTPFEKEADEAFDLRKENTWTTSSYPKALEDHSGRVFSEPIQVSDKLELLSPTLVAMLQRVDGAGTPLDAWARPVFEAAESDGVTYGFVDRAAAEQVRDDGRDPSRADLAGTLPYWIHLDPQEMLDIVGSWTMSGFQVDQVRWSSLERRMDRSSRYGSELWEVARVYTRQEGVVIWEIFERLQASESSRTSIMEPTKTGFLPLAEIPFRWVLFGRHAGGSAPYFAHSFLGSLADKEVERFQVYSEVRDNLSYVLRNVTHYKNFTKAEFDDITSFQNGLAIRTEDKEGAEIRMVDKGTEGQVQGWEILGKLDHEQWVLSRLPLLNTQSGTVTATESALASAAGDATVMANSSRFSEFLNALLRDAARYESVILPDNILSTNTEFGIDLLTGSDAPTILELESRKLISGGTTIEEFRRRDVLAESVTWENEQDRRASEKEATADSQGLEEAALQAAQSALDGGAEPDEAAESGLSEADRLIS